MKKSFILSVLSLVTAATPSFGAGYIWMDNYSSHDFGGPMITYGPGTPADGVGGPLGVPGTGLSSAWTAGIYFASGDLHLNDPFGYGMPDPLLTRATRIGSTAQFASAESFYLPGKFSTMYMLNVGGNAGDLITAEVVIYPTASGSYASAPYRMHSASFTMPTAAVTSGSFPSVGDYMPAFPVPEPGMLALGGLAGLALWPFPRKKA